MKLLVVEDETKTGEYLRQGLIESGFIVDLTNNGLDGYHRAMTEEYDLIILDVMLPDISGWKIIQSLRDAGKETQIIFLTAMGSVEDKVKGLNLGADDYLVKPFSFAELLARIKSLLRRNVPQVSLHQLTIADLVMDLPKRTVTRAGKRIELTNKEFLLLEYFLRYQGEVLPRSLIASQVWDMNFDSDTNVIDVAVRRLRNKIDTPFEPKLIHTIRGMGYKLDVFNENEI
ncbi:heavy metal response regulator transcription factor [Frischella perrara]|jgi:heavy metal response regulator|uniref:DNA-binding response regulator n=1 Tax=Frischella perrara TaxID=1267021 RepID=A0A0A7S248_FRIPE|nr:heavy metal response regulator transcription factor [Frischella perrara]AJA45594.1 heavy metal response regulator [Frischella perrara]MCT6875453.1 heavy metal response regulator transcription factor [Frischella perrara]PWV58953.1 two-component system copper resistance phosphate regulon response regulator CusR [Frischella perrara]PXY95004.1 DNA-binding response regulator [Frischella perrara]